MASVTEPQPETPPQNAAKAGDPLVDRQIRSTRRALKVVDLAAGLITLVIGVLLFLLVASLLEHWVIPGGWGESGRRLLFGVLLAGVGWYCWRTFWPLMRQPINPVYAAKAIEESSPSLKNSLMNLLLLRGHKREMPRQVFNAIEQQAEQRLSQVRLESVVDRSSVLRLGYVLLAVVALCVLYRVLSPKDLFSSAGRVLAPWANIAVPSRVEILDVTPGDTKTARGERVEVSAEVLGLEEDEPVTLLYSTADQQIVRREILMTASAGGTQFSCRLPGRGGRGIEQPVSYWIEAGDARSPKYAVSVFSRPTLVVERVRYEYPAYTGFPSRDVEHTGDVRAVEGTRVTVFATANKPIKTAHVDFAADGRNDLLMNANGQESTVTFPLELREDRRTPRHASYVLRYVTDEGNRNEKPPKYQIDVVPDYSPEIQLLLPEEAVLDVPLNQEVNFELEARDPDFALRQVVLLGKVGDEQRVKEVLLSKDHTGRFVGKLRKTPAELGLQEGDVLEYWGAAADVRRPEPNLAYSAHRKIRVIGPWDGERGEGEGEQQPGEQGQGEGEPQEGEAGQEEGQAGGGEEASGGEGEEGAEGKGGPGQESGEQGEQQGGESGSEGSEQGENSDPQGGNQGENEGESTGEQGQNSEGQQGGEPGQRGGEGGEQGKVSSEGDDDGEAFERIADHFDESGEQGEAGGEGTEGEQQQPSGRGSEGSPDSDQTGEAGDSAEAQEREGESAAGQEGTEQERSGEGEGAEGEPAAGEEASEGEQGEQQGNEPGAEEGMSPEQGDAGAGEGGGENQGTPEQEGAKKPREKQEGEGGESRQQDQEAPSKSSDQTESDSEGGQGGDRSGGGQEGAGQQADEEGTGAAGENQAADDGAGQAQESGEGEAAQPGQQNQAEGKTGEEGDNQPGQGSKQGEQQGDQAGGEAESRGEGEGQQPQQQEGAEQAEGKPGEAGGTGGNNTSPPPGGETMPGDEANLDYARKKTDLILDRLDEQLEKKEVDESLLKKLGWTEQELQRFVDRWKSLKKQVDDSGSADAQNELDQALRSLGLKPRNRTGFDSKTTKDRLRDLQDAFRGRAPLEYQQQIRAYVKGTAKDGESE